MTEAKPPRRGAALRTDPQPQDQSYEESLRAADRELREWVRRRAEQRAQRRAVSDRQNEPGPTFAETGHER